MKGKIRMNVRGGEGKYVDKSKMLNLKVDIYNA